MEEQREYFIKLEDGTKVPVNSDVYYEYYRPKWRELKCDQRDRKRLLSSNYKYENNCAYEDFIADTKPGPEDIAINNEILQFLVQALELLPEEEKNLVQALIIDGKSEREYAKETGFARTTINYRRKKALKQMRDSMEKQFYNQ